MAAAAGNGTRGAGDRGAVAARPAGLSDDLCHAGFDPLPVRALVRSGVGLRRNHELRAGRVLRFGRIRRGPDCPRSRRHVDADRVAGRPVDRAHLRFAARRIPAAGTASIQRHFRFPGHADRVVCRRSAGTRLVLSRRPERHSLDPANEPGQLRSGRGPGILLSRAGHPGAGLSSVSLPGGVAIRIGSRRPARKRAAHRVFRLSGAASQGHHLFGCRRHRGPGRQPLCFPRGFCLAEHAGRGDVHASRALCLVRRCRDPDRGGDRHRRDRGGQLLAVEQLSGYLADHPRRIAAAGYSVSSGRADQPDRQRARTRGRFRPPTEGEKSWPCSRRAASPRSSAN